VVGLQGKPVFRRCRYRRIAAGAFTYYFCRHLRDTQGRVTREQLLKLVRASLKHEGYSQVPQMEGPAGSAREGLFGTS